MLGDPATELIEQANRIPARDAYEMQIKEQVLAYARAVVAENERLRHQVVLLAQHAQSSYLEVYQTAGGSQIAAEIAWRDSAMKRVVERDSDLSLTCNS